MSNGQNGADIGKHSSDHDFSTALMVLIGGFMLYILLVMVIKYLALVSPYFFYIFTMPVFSLAGGRVSAFIIVMIYALICLGVAFFLKKKNGKWGTTAIAYSIFWVFVALGELVFFSRTKEGMISTPLTSHVTKFCNPENDGILYILSCQNTVDDIGAIPVILIILIATVPNIVFGLNALFVSIRNFGRLAKHPKKLAMQRIPNVDALINTVAPKQPHLQIYKDIDPNKIDWNSGQLRLMDTPRRYCFENDLIDGFVKRPSKYNASSYKDEGGTKNTKHKLSFDENEDYVPTIDIEKFEEVMMKDLGEIYTSVDALTSTETVVLALSLSLACRGDLNMDEKEAEGVLKDVQAKCDELFIWVAKDIQTKHKVNLGFEAYPKLEEYRDLIRKWQSHPIAVEIFNNHAYVNTIILRCLTDAKKLGVFQPSSLRWLMFYDRPLFAVVQNESRPSVFAENAATSSHYEFERKAGKKIHRPMFQIAYDGFMDNLREYSYEKKVVKAWELYKDTGDASKMIELRIVSKNFKYGKS